METIKNCIEIIKSKEIIDLLIAVAIFIGFILLSSIFAKIIMKCFKIKPEKLEKKSKLYKILKCIFIISGTYISLLILSLPSNFMAVVTKIFKLILIYLVTRLVANLIRPSSKTFNKMKNTNESANEHTIRFAIKFARGIIYIIGAFIFVTELGYDLSGLVAGLGIGSVVLALAAQDLAKNLFGGFAIISDKTFVIGDTIEVNTTFGTVEDITFRTTRIRKLDNTVITMPNSILADSEIINWSKIKKRRYDCELKLSLDITQKEINNIIKKIEFELQKNTEIIKDSIRVYFSDIEKDGYKITIYLYTDIIDYDEYIKFKNDVNSQILALFEKEHVKLIYPTFDIRIVK
ncbi:MAG: mechanosensitive ion channel family protein [Clostridia bacterium]|nr:mechanosensitive ion channel family protein [Clostridia bacterium]